MFVAVNQDNERVMIEEAKKEERYCYYCPICGNEMQIRAANSENVRTHFAHKRNAHCLDDWNYDMSKWHYSWQMKFPEECREVVMEKDGEKHRADVFIGNTVIEFQHSPMSAEEFEKRNAFYRSCGHDIVWVFDAHERVKTDDPNKWVWNRKITLFNSMKTRPTAVFLQNCLPEEPERLYWIEKYDSKEIAVGMTRILPVMPGNFLKEYGALNDAGTKSFSEMANEFVNKYRLNRPQIIPVQVVKRPVQPTMQPNARFEEWKKYKKTGRQF